MKKLILTFIAVVGFAFTSSAQCDAQSTAVTTDCGTVCLTVEIPLTGIPSVDIANYNASGGTMRRKPNQQEILAYVFSEGAC